MYFFAFLVLLGAANCHVVRNNANLHSLDVNYLERDLDTAIIGDIYLGTPKYGFAVQFDTLYTDSIVPSANCEEEYCIKHDFYNSSKSSTYKPDGTPFEVDTWSIKYSGVLSKDVAEIGDLKLSELTFGEILHVGGRVPQGISPDGIFGLGFGQNKTIVDRMLAEGLIEKPIFSTFLKKNSASSHTKIIFGGSDSNLYKDNLNYVTAYGYGPTWQIAFNGVQVGEDRSSKGEWYAALSLSTRVIIGPNDQITAINTAFGAREFSGLKNVFEIDCSEVRKLPNLQLFLGIEGELQLAPEDYIVRYNFGAEDVCLSVFVGFDTETKETYGWVLGLPVFSKFYAEFDAGNRKVGFAIAA